MAVRINSEAFTDGEGIALVRENVRVGLNSLIASGCPAKWLIAGLEQALRDLRLEHAAND